jgi:hypothetical protein
MVSLCPLQNSFSEADKTILTPQAASIHAWSDTLFLLKEDNDGLIWALRSQIVDTYRQEWKQLDGTKTFTSTGLDIYKLHAAGAYTCKGGLVFLLFVIGEATVVGIQCRS